MNSQKINDEFDDLSKTTPFVDPSKFEKEDEQRYESEWEKTSYFPSKIDSDKTKAYVFQSPPQVEHISQKKPVTSVPTQPLAIQKDNEKDKIPPIFWYLTVSTVFLLLAATIMASYLLFSKKHGFDVILVGAHPNSDVFVNGVRWGISSSDGSIRILGLRAGEHRIEVKNPNYIYDTENIRGNDGQQVKVTLKFRGTITHQLKNNECEDIRKGEFEKAARCANEALDKLGENFTVEELLRAMNLYIINFDSGKYNIKSQDMKFLEKAAGYMKKLPPHVKIEVGGHTDNVGNNESNMKLSENRAKAVRDALVSFGVKPEMLETRGYGETKPKASNDTEDGRFQNRRIEYTAIIRNQ